MQFALEPGNKVTLRLTQPVNQATSMDLNDCQKLNCKLDLELRELHLEIGDFQAINNLTTVPLIAS